MLIHSDDFCCKNIGVFRVLQITIIALLFVRMSLQYSCIRSNKGFYTC
nr:MAG TPA: hypothetical protein [Caudoviricetes sp.]